MLALLKLLILCIILMMIVSFFVGAAVFIADIHRFKSSIDSSLSRRKLLERLADEQELKQTESEVKENVS
ncbi:MAG: hypothetical protein Q4E74_09190 [Ruminococcus sp.]|nr:hypothetical protein [Ruminococcus sp.]